MPCGLLLVGGRVKIFTYIKSTGNSTSIKLSMNEIGQLQPLLQRVEVCCLRLELTIDTARGRVRTQVWNPGKVWNLGNKSSRPGKVWNLGLGLEKSGIRSQTCQPLRFRRNDYDFRVSITPLRSTRQSLRYLA